MLIVCMFVKGIVRFIFNQQPLLSSPEHKVLKLSFYDSWMSIVHLQEWSLYVSL